MGGLRGLQPPLNFQKNSGHPRGRCDSFIHVAVGIDVVVTSSNNAVFVFVEWCCCRSKAQFSHDCLIEAAPTS